MAWPYDGDLAAANSPPACGAGLDPTRPIEALPTNGTVRLKAALPSTPLAVELYLEKGNLFRAGCIQSDHKRAVPHAARSPVHLQPKLFEHAVA